MDLPKIIDNDIRADFSLTYNMKLSAKLSHIHSLVTVANIEADERLECLRNLPSYKKKILIGDHVLLFCEQSSAAKESKLPWLDQG